MSGLNPQQISALLAKANRSDALYLIGIGGCGMSGLAHLLLDLGHRVHGSDAVENDGIRQLRERGAVIHIGHSAGHLRAAEPVTLVVFSPAVRPDNVEVEMARESGLPTVRRAVLLAALAQRQRGICVTGMHGKTTTSALLTWALRKLDVEPSYAIGAPVPQLPAPAHLCGSAENWFVAEADESDGTLREFRPRHSIILNVDEEHFDYFTDIEAACREFEEFAAYTEDVVVYCADDARLAAFVGRRPRAVSFGFSASADYRAEITEAPAAGFQSRFAVFHHGENMGEFVIGLIGEKNVSNASAVIALLHQCGYAPADIARAIRDFHGAARRQEELFADGHTRVVDDYGHHPNEVRATLSAFRQLQPRRLVVAFQPHRYTRTLQLMPQFVESLAGADKLFLTEVYAASEPEIPGANAAALAAAIRGQGREVEYVPQLRDLSDAVLRELHPGDLVLFLGAGDITRAAHQCANALRRGAGMEFMRSSPLTRFRSVVSEETIVRENEPLAKRTTLRVGGNADFYLEPATERDLAQALQVCAELKLPFFIIGRGSNLLVKDGGIRGVVIGLGHENLSRVQIIGEQMHCGAGARLKAVAAEARRAHLAGFEFLEGIPGTVGGALRMNAGAMGSWMFEVVEQIRFMDFAGNVHERTATRFFSK